MATMYQPAVRQFVLNSRNFFTAQTSIQISSPVRNKANTNYLPIVRAARSSFSRQTTRSVRLRAMTGESVTVRSVPVAVANELLEAGHFFVDVRTSEEFQAGHVEGAINIPYMYTQSGGMVKNAEFVVQVAEKFDKAQELVLGCAGGKRSMAAIKELQEAEFTACIDMGGGFNAWVASGLSISKEAGKN